MKSMFFRLSSLVILAIGVAQMSEVQAAHPFGGPVDAFELLRKLDTNGDNRLSEKEFMGEKAGSARVKARRQFRNLNNNGDDFLSLSELRRAN
ncbi:MAG TPA: hypothetical protein VHC22_03010 [Pirellulales bacterium]|nr:hypothetical protein [Pirellulales bacterium]